MLTLTDNILQIGGYQSLRKVSEHRILVYFSAYQLDINGKNLRITLLTQDDVTISGMIQAILFTDEA